MKRGVNNELLKRLRKERSWSQEELSIASGVSLRTVQRLEAEESSSVRTLKCIAAALEVDMHNLEGKPRTQLVGVRWGYAGVIVGSVCATIAILVDWLIGGASPFVVGMSFGAVGLFSGLCCFAIGFYVDHTL